MNCAEIQEAFGLLNVTSRPVPACPDAGLLLKTVCSGVCHSDVHIVDDEIDLGSGKTARMRDAIGDAYKGLVLGHEICGEVLVVGNEAPASCHIRPGDHVIIYPWRGCRNCEACNAGENQLCENNSIGSTDIGLGSNSGGYSSYVAVPEWELAVKLPGNIAPKIGCMLPCSALTAYCAIQKTKAALDLAVRLRGFANLLVIGCGGLGMWVIVLIKSVFCDKNVKVICADISQSRLDIALAHGADDAVLWKPDADDLVDHTTMSGFNKMDAAIDFVGGQKTLSTAIDSLHSGGAVASVGLHGGELKLSIPNLISRSISIHGIRVGSMANLRSVVELLSVQNIEKYPPVELCKLDDINSVLDRMRKGLLQGRAIINFAY